MPTPPDPPVDHAAAPDADARTRLLRGVAAAVAEKGYAATTITDIVGHAHASKRTFYEHFTDKQACYLEAYRRGTDRLGRRMLDGGTAAEGPWRTRLRAAIDAYLGVLIDAPASTRTFTAEILAAGPDAVAERRRMHRRTAEALCTLVDRLREDEPGLAPLPPAIADAIVGALTELVHGAVASEDATALPAVAEPVVALLAATLTAPADAGALDVTDTQGPLAPVREAAPALTAGARRPDGTGRPTAGPRTGGRRSDAARAPLRTALVTGASSGIGLEIARVLGQEGHALTVVARRPDKLAAAADLLRGEGFDVLDVAADLDAEDEIARVVALHRERWGRLDVLVNNAGVGVAEPVEDLSARRIDLQLDVNLRSPMLFHREAIGLLREAAAEHREALIVNTASVTGIHGEPTLPVYAATKAAIINWTSSMHLALSREGIRSTALCPGLVDTAMTDHAKDAVAADAMMTAADVAEAVRFVLAVSPVCCVPAIELVRSGERMM